MRPAINRSRLIAIFAAGVASACLSAQASAQDLQYSTSCLDGFVDAYDYAELSANFAEFGWDSRGALKLQSNDEAITLKVLDQTNQMVCDNVADLRTSCTWTLNPGGVYTVRIDNVTRSTQTTYRLCAN